MKMEVIWRNGEHWAEESEAIVCAQSTVVLYFLVQYNTSIFPLCETDYPY